MSEIKKCTCANEYQDTKYGTGKRVMNKTTKTAGAKPLYRCTVCLSTTT